MCGAEKLDLPLGYLEAFKWQHVFSVRLKESQARLAVIFARRTEQAIREYNHGCDELERYVVRLKLQDQQIWVYLRALSHFDHCVFAADQAVRAWQVFCRTRAAKAEIGPDEKLLRDLRDRYAHFDDDLHKGHAPQDITHPIWITNTGLACTRGALSFAALSQILSELARAMAVLCGPPVSPGDSDE